MLGLAAPYSFLSLLSPPPRAYKNQVTVLFLFTCSEQGLVRWLLLSIRITGGETGALHHAGHRDKAAASPNCGITCTSSSIFLSPGFQLSELLYSSSAGASEAYSALFLLIIAIRAISGAAG